MKLSALSKGRAAFYAALLACAAALRLLPSLTGGVWEGLSAQGVSALAILAFAVISWTFELVPVSVTALWVLALIPFSGLMSLTETVSVSFGNSIFVFFLGVLLLSAAFQKTNLSRAIAAVMVRVFGNRPRSVIFGIMLTGALLAMWVTEVAAAAIVYPIALSVAEQTRERADGARLRTRLMLAVAWGAAFGGVATPIATGSSLVALQYLKELGGITIDFLEWMKAGVPICAALLAAGWLMLSSGIQNDSPLRLERSLPRLTKNDCVLLAVFLFAVVMWVLGEVTGISSHYIALLAGVLLFLPGLEVMEWKSAVKEISWDSIILICSGMALGALIYRCGVAEWLSGLLFFPEPLQAGGFISAFYIVCAVSLLKVLFSGNTVSGIVMTPIMLSLAQSLNMPPWTLVAPCAFSAALSLLTVTSSPVNVIPYASGWFTPRDMLKFGGPMTLASAVIIAGWLALTKIA